MEKKIHDNDMDNDGVWFFAIGAMMNPVSIKLRDIHPMESQPGELLDHSLYWFGQTGVAEAIEAPGKSFHGVLHRVKLSDMERLDVIERGYDRKVAKAKLYQTTNDNDHDVQDNVKLLLNVTVYTRFNVDRGTHIDSLPKQRYLEIIISGAEHYGVDPHYIQTVLKDQECQPRKLPHEFKSFNANDKDETKLPYMTMDDIRQNYHGQDEDTPFCFPVNGKVLLWEGNNEGKQEWCKIHHDENTSAEMVISRILYDPKYGLPECTEDFTREHSANIENEYYEYFSAVGILKDWRVIAKIKQTYKDNDEKCQQ